jgi:hypothetical protein
MSTTYQEKEFVYLPIDLAKKVKGLEDVKEIENEILKYVADSKLSLRQDIANIDDEIVVYKASMIKARQSFKTAMDEEFAEWEKLWEEKSGLYDKIQAANRKFKDSTSVLKQELDSVKQVMQSIDKWDIEALLGTIETISSHLSYNGETGKILKFLFDNYKRPTA